VPRSTFCEHFLHARQRQALAPNGRSACTRPAARTCLPGRGKPIFSGSCWARHADMISRNRRTSTSSASGPALRSTTRRSTCASRSGR
jgi:hypothetical protein